MRLNSVIIFTFGVAAGGLAATLFWREKYRQKYKKEAEEKNASMLEYVNRLRESEGKKAQTQYSEASETNEPTETENVNRRNNPRVRVNYSDIYSQMNKAEEKLAECEYPKEDEETGDERQVKEQKMKNDKYEKPRIIKALEFENQYTWFDKVTLLYYTEDQVLVTADDNEPVDDVERLIGDALDKYGFRNNDEKVIYVRNFSRGTDYEIAKYNFAWADS